MRYVLALLLSLLAAPAFAQGFTVTGPGALGVACGTNALGINTPSGVTQSIPFTLSGCYSGAAPADTPIALDGGTAATCSAVIAAGVWSCPYTIATTGLHRLTVSSTTSGDTRAATTAEFSPAGSTLQALTDTITTSETLTGTTFVPYQGPVDVQSGATLFAGLFAGSNSGALSTADAVQLTRNLDGHSCNLPVTPSGQLGPNVDGCTSSGENGTAFSTWGASGVLVEGIPYQVQAGGFSAAANGSGFTTPTFTANCYNSTLYCWSFNGTSQEATSNIPASNFFSNGTTFTIIAWIEPTETINTNAYGIFGAETSLTPSFRLDGQSGDATATLRLQTATVSGGAISTCTISVNAWHGVAVSYDGSTAKFYTEAGTCGSVSISLTFANITTTGMVIGTSAFGSTTPQFPFKGNIRAIAVWPAVYSDATVEAMLAKGPPSQ